jgi:hypothetical protein
MQSYLLQEGRRRLKASRGITNMIVINAGGKNHLCDHSDCRRGGRAGRKARIIPKAGKRARTQMEAEIRASELRRLADPSPQSVEHEHPRAYLG